jgi:hypothetical protein
VVLDDYECNISKLGRVGFTGVTFVLGKKVVTTVRYENLVPYEPKNNVGE